MYLRSCYQPARTTGEEVREWASRLDLALIYNSNDPGTFRSARCRADNTPDLVFVTRNGDQNPLPVTRQVLGDFPHSQHRPILITAGILLSAGQTLPKPRWNFCKAKWEKYVEEIETKCTRIPANVENYKRFKNLMLVSAKKHIPKGFRKLYIPCWSERRKELLEELERTQDQEIAEELLNSLQEGRRERWIEVVEGFDMRHSSRHACATIKKLDPEKSKSKSSAPIEADVVGKEIKQRSQHTPDHNFEKYTRKTYQNLFKTLPTANPILDSPITSEEAHEATKEITNGKAAGVDRIFPDMLTHLGPKATLWIAKLMSNIKDTSKYPQEWKHARTIAILKPGKPTDQASSYRPISLLCCMYKLLERVLLKKITPMVDQHIPMNQAGFRSNRNTTEQVLALTRTIESGFELREKTGVVLINLSAAYDTVWTVGPLADPGGGHMAMPPPPQAEKDQA